MPRKINQELTDYLNKELVPIFKESAHEYFGENFLDDFFWQDSKNKKFLGAIKRKRKSEPIEYYVSNGPLWESDGGFIDDDGHLELEKGLFHKGKITGKGVHTFFHEIAHCWLNYKFEGEFDLFRKSGNRVQYNVSEGFCDFTAYDIIETTKIKKEFSESFEYSRNLKKVYSLTNFLLKNRENPTRPWICKKNSRKDFNLVEFSKLVESVFGNGGFQPTSIKLEYSSIFSGSNRTLRAKIFGILSCYDNLKQRENFLMNPPRTMQELNQHIPKLQN